MKVEDAPPGPHGQDAERPRVEAPRLDRGERPVGVRGVVQLDEPAVVHAVDVIARKDEDAARARAQSQRDAHRVRRAAIVPVDGRRGERPDPVEALAPGSCDVMLHGLVQVLGQHQDVADARAGAVAQGEVDEPAAPERHDRLGSIARQGPEAIPFAAGQDVQEAPRSPLDADALIAWMRWVTSLGAKVPSS